MIVHVMNRAIAANIGPVIVATDSDAIAGAVTAAGGRAIMTRADHASGSDRIFEALTIADPDGRATSSSMCRATCRRSTPPIFAPHSGPFADPPSMSRRLRPKSPSLRTRQSECGQGRRLAGSAGPAARTLFYARDAPYGDGPLYHHIGLYAYRRAALEHFVSLPPSPLERREKLEQLALLEVGRRIDVTVVASVPLGVDTPEDLERARALLARG